MEETKTIELKEVVKEGMKECLDERNLNAALDLGYNDKFVAYKDKDNDWRWQRVAPNGQVVAVPGEGYKNFSHCFKMIQRMCRGCNIENIDVED